MCNIRVVQRFLLQCVWRHSDVDTSAHRSSLSTWTISKNTYTTVDCQRNIIHHAIYIGIVILFTFYCWFYSEYNYDDDDEPKPSIVGFGCNFSNHFDRRVVYVVGIMLSHAKCTKRSSSLTAHICLRLLLLIVGSCISKDLPTSVEKRSEWNTNKIKNLTNHV